MFTLNLSPDLKRDVTHAIFRTSGYWPDEIRLLNMADIGMAKISAFNLKSFTDGVGMFCFLFFIPFINVVTSAGGTWSKIDRVGI